VATLQLSQGIQDRADRHVNLSTALSTASTSASRPGQERGPGRRPGGPCGPVLPADPNGGTLAMGDSSTSTVFLWNTKTDPAAPVP
jgi:hypothetical protein